MAVNFLFLNMGPLKKLIGHACRSPYIMEKAKGARPCANWLSLATSRASLASQCIDEARESLIIRQKYDLNLFINSFFPLYLSNKFLFI